MANPNLNIISDASMQALDPSNQQQKNPSKAHSLDSLVNSKAGKEPTVNQTHCHYKIISNHLG
jgi:hypothetical protein